MTAPDLTREQLVEVVTREVLAALAERADILSNPEKLRQVVANGADRVAYHGDAEDVPVDLAKYIDHTLLRPDTTADDIDELCDEALEASHRSASIRPGSSAPRSESEGRRSGCAPSSDSPSAPPPPRSRRWRHVGPCATVPASSTW